MLIIEKWIARHPEWFEQTRIDIEPGHEGWSQLIDEVFAAAEQILSDHSGVSFGIAQVKPKLGALRIYFRQEGLPAEISDRLYEIKRAAEDRSLAVCEICGAPAHLGWRNSWLSVRCDACAPAGWMSGPEESLR
jgi:hypothetical protein